MKKKTPPLREWRSLSLDFVNNGPRTGNGAADDVGDGPLPSAPPAEDDGNHDAWAGTLVGEAATDAELMDGVSAAEVVMFAQRLDSLSRKIVEQVRL